MNKIRKNLILSGAIKPSAESNEHPTAVKAQRRFDDRPVLIKRTNNTKRVSMAAQQHRSRS